MKKFFIENQSLQYILEIYDSHKNKYTWPTKFWNLPYQQGKSLQCLTWKNRACGYLKVGICIGVVSVALWLRRWTTDLRAKVQYPAISTLSFFSFKKILNVLSRVLRLRYSHNVDFRDKIRYYADNASKCFGGTVILDHRYSTSNIKTLHSYSTPWNTYSGR